MSDRASPPPDDPSPANGANAVEGAAKSPASSPVAPGRRGPTDLDDELARLPADPARRRRWAFELVAVVCLAVLPDLYYALMAPVELGAPRGWTTSDNVGLLVRSLQVGVPVLYLMLTSGEPRQRFGLVRPGVAASIVGGAAMAGVWVGLWTLLAGIPLIRELPSPALPTWPAGRGPVALLVAAELANGIAEELVARAYLVTRIEDLTRHAGASILAAATLFASYHCYQGTLGIVHALLFGAFYGVVFRITRSIGPLVVGHCLGNLWVLGT